MVIGVSLGANRMTNLLGELGETDLIDAACILSALHKLWIATEAAKTACDGFYDKALGQNVAALYMKHEHVLKDRYKEDFDIDLKEILESMEPIRLTEIDEKITSKIYGYDGMYDYHYKAACCWAIPNIKIPTLFMNALDDPLIDEAVIDFDSIKANENCILATSKTGGHVGYFESFFGEKNWCRKSVLDFLYLLSI